MTPDRDPDPSASATSDVLSLTKGLRPGEAALCRGCEYFLCFASGNWCLPHWWLIDPGLRIVDDQERCDTKREENPHAL